MNLEGLTINMNELPLVSILMAAYNREVFIREAIESVIISTYKNWELIIVDDCSTDKTFEIAKEYEIKDSRIKLYKNEKNLGQFENRNKTAGYAKGKYLKYLDSDDAIFPWGIEYCVQEMEKYPEANIGMLYLGKKKLTNSIVMSSEDVIRNHYFDGSILGIGPSGCIFKRLAFESYEGFDAKFDLAADNFLNIQMAISSPVVLLTEVFFKYRMHEGQAFIEKDMIIYSYLYNKDLYESGQLPLKAEELLYLRKKLEKRQLVNLIKYFFKSKSLKGLVEVVEKTKYKWWNGYKYIFY